MRTSALLIVAVAAALAAGDTSTTMKAAGQTSPASPFSWSDPPPLATPFPPPSTEPEPLPVGSIAEPFEIGEALYDPGRADQAVMSLLAKMRIGVASSSASAKGLSLDESEARTLIALAEDDLRGGDDLENLPFGFVDLHRAVSGLLPQMTIETLAETYTRVYAEQPDSLAAKVMMGQPLDPETRLTRAQIWLLLMDGFAGPGGADAAYGAADRELPDLPSPNPAWSAAEWREALARLPLVAASRLLAVERADTGASLRLAQSPALLSRLTGKPLVASRAGSLAGQEVTWELADESALQDLATLGTPTGQATRVATNGVARFAVTPTAASVGPGELVRQWVSVSAALPACPLVSSAYAVPPPLCAFILGPRRLDAPLALSWRTTDKLRVEIVYRYALQLQTPIGSVTRKGVDSADGWIVRRPNGSYSGTMTGTAFANQLVRGSDNCDVAEISATQQLHVEGRMLLSFQQPGTGSQYGGALRTRDLTRYHWATPDPGNIATQGVVLGDSWAQQPPADGYLVLEFFPKTFPKDEFGRPVRLDPDACLPLIEATDEQSTHGAGYFIPYNDAQWTTPEAGYAIGLRRDRDYYFVDDNNAVGYLLGRELDFSVNTGAGTGRPRWTVRVQRPPLVP